MIHRLTTVACTTWNLLQPNAISKMARERYLAIAVHHVGCAYGSRPARWPVLVAGVNGDLYNVGMDEDFISDVATA
jgi:hypothetical protein